MFGDLDIVVLLVREYRLGSYSLFVGAQRLARQRMPYNGSPLRPRCPSVTFARRFGSRDAGTRCFLDRADG
ncbi:hypothetical protein CVN56_31225 [Rhodococcus sp. AQ5-07]|nr:hypothetical protein CVN56_31225 [Rhodococcus sp. AQ5-07]